MFKLGVIHPDLLCLCLAHSLTFEVVMGLAGVPKTNDPPSPQLLTHTDMRTCSAHPCSGALWESQLLTWDVLSKISVHPGSNGAQALPRPAGGGGSELGKSQGPWVP